MAHADNIQLFSACSAEEKDWLRSVLARREHAEGRIIFSEGDPGNGVHFLEHGTVSISSLPDDGVPKVLTRIEAGDFFGEMAALDGESRSATARAETDAVTWLMTTADFQTVTERIPGLALRMMREFSRRMRAFDRTYLREVIEAERLAVLGRFARTIVHDLKNPLSTIGMAAELLGRDSLSAEKRRSYSDRIRRQMQRINGMVNELIDFTRAGASDLALQTLPFASFFTECLPELKESLKDPTHSLVVAQDPPDIVIPLEPRKLTHVLRNLVVNASEAMDSDGEVTLGFEVTATHLEIDVRDTGPGIPDAVRETLFVPFVTHGKLRGTGLGLAITRRIVEEHRGEIQLLPNPEGGARFRIRLPLGAT